MPYYSKHTGAQVDSAVDKINGLIDGSLTEAEKKAIGANINLADNAQLTAELTRLAKTYAFGGVATPSTNPGTPEVNTFYLATEAGTYANMGGVELKDSGLYAIIWDGERWSAIRIVDLVTPAEVSQIILDNTASEVTADGVTPVSGSAVAKELETSLNLISHPRKQEIVFRGDVNSGQKILTVDIPADSLLQAAYWNATVTGKLAVRLVYEDGTNEYMWQGPNATEVRDIKTINTRDRVVKILLYYPEADPAYFDVRWIEGVQSAESSTPVCIVDKVYTLYKEDGSSDKVSYAWGASAPIRVAAGQVYTFRATQFPSSPYVAVLFYDEQMNVLSAISGASLVVNADNTVQVAQDGYMRISYRRSQGYSATLNLNEAPRPYKTINRAINNVGMSIWWYDGNTLSAGFMGGEIARGYQTKFREQFIYPLERKYCYSGHSLGGQTDTDSSCIMVELSASGLCVATDADIWTLDTITNDFKRNIPIGSIDDYNNATGITTYYGALRAFADKVATLSGDKAIVICSNALPRNNSGYTSISQNTQGHTLLDYSVALQRVAAMKGWEFIDQFKYGSIDDSNLSLATIDGLHLNNYGYSLAVRPWLDVLQNIAYKDNENQTI